MRAIVNSPEPSTFKATKASLAEFPALDGQSVSFAVLQYPANSISDPHTHPCYAELLFLLLGTVEVGFIDTTNKLFTKVLQPPDVLVFPMGLVHYRYHSVEKNYSAAVSAFGSSCANTTQASIKYMEALTMPWSHVGLCVCERGKHLAMLIGGNDL
ncbi:Cupin 1 [Dillenia turbinata]|uniref:Germin-like protein n=1 Tax=Dillenia turbinata TaxID=194707 RepID=A0AAN8Z747_9MAGN